MPSFATPNGSKQWLPMAKTPPPKRDKPQDLPLDGSNNTIYELYLKNK